MKFVWERALAIARKEVFHIRRDPYTLALSLGFPLFMVLMYGYAIDFNLTQIRLAVNDADQTQVSRQLLETFGSSGYFRLHATSTPGSAYQEVAGERAKATLIIPPQFERDIHAGRSAQAQVLVDGADGSVVGSVTAYLGGIQTLANQNIAGFRPPQPLRLETRFLFNPELKSSWFVIPGLIVVVMTILSLLLTALTISREWENGSMELLLSTPIQPLEIILGKLLPYGGLGLIAIGMTYTLARTLFHVPFNGNLGTFWLGCFLFLVTYLGQGLLISVVARNQQVAMQMAMISGLLPSNLLSGFIFPIASMPLLVRTFTLILPARWFMTISRSCFLKGTSTVDLFLPFLALLLIGLLMLRTGARRFKRNLEP